MIGSCTVGGLGIASDDLRLSEGKKMFSGHRQSHDDTECDTKSLLLEAILHDGKKRWSSLDFDESMCMEKLSKALSSLV